MWVALTLVRWRQTIFWTLDQEDIEIFIFKTWSHILNKLKKQESSKVLICPVYCSVFPDILEIVENKEISFILPPISSI